MFGLPGFKSGDVDLSFDQLALVAGTAGMASFGIAPLEYAEMSAERQANAIRDQQLAAEKQGIKNQNALVNQAFNKRRNTMGLGDSFGLGTSPMGNAASQEGAILTSVVGNGVSGLG
jgi:hypothetical protein